MMKSRIVFFCLLTVLACKDGGGLVSPSRSRPSGWIFNQTVATTSFSSPIGLDFSSNSSSQFAPASGSNTFSFLFRNTGCTPIASQVQVNATSLEFQPASCGTGIARWIDSNGQVTQVREYYFIVTSRSLGNILEVLSFGFFGKDPKSGMYSTEELLFGEYSIFLVRSDGSGTGIASYRAFSGTINAVVNRGFLIKSDGLRMIEANSKSVISMKVDLGCCAD
jgi:hypothetical protein